MSICGRDERRQYIIDLYNSDKPLLDFNQNAERYIVFTAYQSKHT